MTVHEMYARWTLDCVVEAAVAVAHDAAKRPRFYKEAGGVVQELANFRSLVGVSPNWPNAAQRAVLYGAVLGSCDGKPGEKTGSFHSAAAALRNAAGAYSERVYDSGEPMLKQAFVDTAIAFASYLSTMTGAAVDGASAQTGAIFSESVNLLKDPGVAKAFGLDPPGRRAAGEERRVVTGFMDVLAEVVDDQVMRVIRARLPVLGGEAGNGESDERHPRQWTFDPSDGTGGMLLEEVTRALQPAAGALISQQQFTALQRAALLGSGTIEAAIGGAHNDDDTVIRMITSAYGWATALRAAGK